MTRRPLTDHPLELANGQQAAVLPREVVIGIPAAQTPAEPSKASGCSAVRAGHSFPRISRAHRVWPW
jgi:hypothetical protein